MFQQGCAGHGPEGFLQALADLMPLGVSSNRCDEEPSSTNKLTAYTSKKGPPRSPDKKYLVICNGTRPGTPTSNRIHVAEMSKFVDMVVLFLCPILTFGEPLVLQKIVVTLQPDLVAAEFEQLAPLVWRLDFHVALQHTAVAVEPLEPGGGFLGELELQVHYPPLAASKVVAF